MVVRVEITLHSEDLVHPIKKVNAAAQAWSSTSK